MSKIEANLGGPIMASFNYEGLPDADRAGMQKAAARIREKIASISHDFLAIGRELAEVKDRLPHGRFEEWCGAEFGFSQRTAQNYMNAAAFVKGLPDPISETLSLLPPATLYKLASPSAPKEIVSEIIEAAEAGALPEPEKISARIADARNKILSEKKHKGGRGVWRKNKARHAPPSPEEQDKHRRAQEKQARLEKEQTAKLELILETYPEVMSEIGTIMRALDWRFQSILRSLLQAREAGAPHEARMASGATV